MRVRESSQENRQAIHACFYRAYALLLLRLRLAEDQTSSGEISLTLAPRSSSELSAQTAFKALSDVWIDCTYGEYACEAARPCQVSVLMSREFRNGGNLGEICESL